MLLFNFIIIKWEIKYLTIMLTHFIAQTTFTPYLNLNILYNLFTNVQTFIVKTLFK